MADFLDLPTLIIIGVAIFVFYRLRSVLGTRTGNERPPSERGMSRFSESQEDKQQGRANDKSRDDAGNDAIDDVVVPLRPQSDGADPQAEANERIERKFESELDRYAKGQEDIRAGLTKIHQSDPGFMPKSFINGATAAYEMILTAYNGGDRGTLKPLLDKDVYEGFEAAIKAREAAGHRVDFTFVGLPNIEFADVDVDKKSASITMRFTAEIVSATRDLDGELIEGDSEQVMTIQDEWTFARSLRSRDPNWKLVATNQLN